MCVVYINIYIYIHIYIYIYINIFAYTYGHIWAKGGWGVFRGDGGSRGYGGEIFNTLNSIHGFLITWLGHSQIGHGICNRWFCTAWPAAWPAAWSEACTALCEALVQYIQRGGCKRPSLAQFGHAI